MSKNSDIIMLSDSSEEDTTFSDNSTVSAEMEYLSSPSTKESPKYMPFRERDATQVAAKTARIKARRWVHSRAKREATKEKVTRLINKLKQQRERREQQQQQEQQIEKKQGFRVSLERQFDAMTYWSSPRVLLEEQSSPLLVLNDEQLMSNNEPQAQVQAEAEAEEELPVLTSFCENDELALNIEDSDKEVNESEEQQEDEHQDEQEDDEEDEEETDCSSRSSDGSEVSEAEEENTRENVDNDEYACTFTSTSSSYVGTLESNSHDANLAQAVNIIKNQMAIRIQGPTNEYVATKETSSFPPSNFADPTTVQFGQPVLIGDNDVQFISEAQNEEAQSNGVEVFELESDDEEDNRLLPSAVPSFVEIASENNDEEISPVDVASSLEENNDKKMQPLEVGSSVEENNEQIPSVQVTQAVPEQEPFVCKIMNIISDLQACTSLTPQQQEELMSRIFARQDSGDQCKEYLNLLNKEIASLEETIADKDKEVVRLLRMKHVKMQVKERIMRFLEHKSVAETGAADNQNTQTPAEADPLEESSLDWLVPQNVPKRTTSTAREKSVFINSDFPELPPRPPRAYLLPKQQKRKVLDIPKLLENLDETSTSSTDSDVDSSANLLVSLAYAMEKKKRKRRENSMKKNLKAFMRTYRPPNKKARYLQASQSCNSIEEPRQQELPPCDFCKVRIAQFACQQCESTFYCTELCQQLDYSDHISHCR